MATTVGCRMAQERIQAAYYETHSALNTLYRQRKRTLFHQKIMWGITGLYIVLMLAVMVLGHFPDSDNGILSFFRYMRPNAENPYVNIYPLAGLILLLYASTIFFAKAFQKFKTKEKVTMAKMVGTLFPQVEFTQGAMAPVKQIVQSKLFAWIKEDSSIYNYGQIRSSSNGAQINIVDVGIAEKKTIDKFIGTIMYIPVINMLGVLYQNVFKNMGTNKMVDNTNYAYRGMFCWMSFKKNLEGHTVVLPKNLGDRLDRCVNFSFNPEQQVHLEDIRFAEKFMVYSTDQVEARYVLSASVMEKIVALKEKVDRPIYLSFQNQKMFFAVENENGLFSFPSGRLDNMKVLEELVNEINTALQVSTAVKLG